MPCVQSAILLRVLSMIQQLKTHWEPTETVFWRQKVPNLRYFLPLFLKYEGFCLLWRLISIGSPTIKPLMDYRIYELGFNRLASQCKFLQFELHNNVWGRLYIVHLRVRNSKTLPHQVRQHNTRISIHLATNISMCQFVNPQMCQNTAQTYLSRKVF